MNDRSRLRQGEFQARVEAELEDQIREHEELRNIQERRRKRETASNRGSAESLAKALEQILAGNKTLAALLGEGPRVRNPHRPDKAGHTVVGFIGKRFPTKFRLKGTNSGETHRREAYLGSKVRLTFETDAANDYFSRVDEPGRFHLFEIADGWRQDVKSYSRPRLVDGRGRMALEIPEGARVGDELSFVIEVDDPSRIEPFEQRFILKVCAEREKVSGTRGKGSIEGDSEGDKKGIGGGKGDRNKD